MADLPNRQDFGDYGEWPGRAVLDSGGQAIGEVREIYLDQSTGRPEWVLVRTEGEAPRFVPLAGASVEGESLRVAFSSERVREAPDYGGDKRLDQDQERTLYDHYGVPYSESASESGLPEPGAPVGDTSAADTIVTATTLGAAGGGAALVADEEAGRAAEDATPSEATGSVQAPADLSELTTTGDAGDAAAATTGDAGDAGDAAAATTGGPGELDRADAREDIAAAEGQDDESALSAAQDAPDEAPATAGETTPLEPVAPTWEPPSPAPSQDTGRNAASGIKAAASSRSVQLAGAGAGALLLLLLVRRLRS